MKLPLSWLQDYVKFKETPEQLAELLTMSGTEVTNIEKAGAQIDDKVVVAEVLAINKHPNADKLQLVKVRVSSQKQYEVVCGAYNFKVGDKVPFAPGGAQLATGLKLKKAVIRGVESNGMLCAEDELGLGDNHTGIVILDKSAQLGTKANKALGVAEVVFDLEITPNRPDCLSIIGLARETAVVTNNKLRITNYNLNESEEKIEDLLSVKVADKDLCPLYSARVIRGIKIKQSPEWLKKRLLASGVRPINNIVDATNYIMLETGQPLHAFDRKRIKEIVVRKAKRGEKIKTLDGQNRLLDNSMCLITDGQKPIAIGGVMGGANSEVGFKTKDIILESAFFDPAAIRKTSKKLNLRSESSWRFEKGVDNQKTVDNLDRAAALIAKLSGGQILKDLGLVDNTSQKKVVINLNPQNVEKLLGITVTKARIKNILINLGFVVSGAKSLKVTVPSWRLSDVSLEADLIEEVGRIVDYNQMTPTYIKGEMKPPAPNQQLQLLEKVRDVLMIAGMIEIYSYSFYGDPLDKSAHVEIANPLSEGQKYMRTSFQEVMGMMAHNLNYYDQLKVFEIGKLFFKKGKGQVEEKTMVFGLVASKKSDNAYFTAKGILNFLTRRLGIKDYQPALVELRQANFSEIAKYKVPDNTALFLLDAAKLFKLISSKRYQPFSAYPSVERDIAFWIDKKYSYQEIDKSLTRVDPLLVEIECFDQFADQQNKKRHSLALRFTFQSGKRTLKSEEVDKILDKIIKKLQTKFQIELRS
ncbi:MAG: phenylalanine--tRNA ligase subunit beta [Patescibacteria group bacterium]